MKKTKLNWFDRLMVNVTFAEAGIDEPEVPYTARNTECRADSFREEQDLFAPGQDCTVPANS